MKTIKVNKVIAHKRWVAVEVVEGSDEHKELLQWNKAMNYIINQDRKELELQNEREQMEISTEYLFEESGFELPDISTFSPDEECARQELRIKVGQAVSELKDRQKEIVIMHFYDGKSKAEIARALNVAESTVSITLERALKNLKKKLENL